MPTLRRLGTTGRATLENKPVGRIGAMQVDQLAISLPPSLLTFLANYQHTHAVSSPSEVVVKALELLREQELATLPSVDEATAEGRDVASTVEPAAPTRPTVLQRMGGMPKHLLSVGGLSDRDTRRTAIANRIQSRHSTKS